ncbi:MAG TPA: class I SAM-dependent methyltransferase [Gaiellaceae bacterium]
MDWPYEIAERDHDIQNPTSAEKIQLLGEYIRLDAASRVLDIACGKAGPAVLLASTHGCRITGVEVRQLFADEARARISAAGLEALVEIHTADAREYALEPETWDAALCLGAAFVWGDIGDAAAAMVPAVKRGGFVAIGEPYWKTPSRVDDGYVDLATTVDRFTATGLALTGIIAASEDDWDRYESPHWRAMEEWLATQTDAHDLRTKHERRRREHLTRREQLGWAIFVGMTPH